ncbi:MAG: hypothetical protein WCK77_16450 [Verrucomicrobiota bacterium]
MIIKLPNQKALVLSPSTVGLAICRAIIETYYPDAPRAALPEGVTDQPWHVLCPRGEIEEGETVYGLMRDPIHAFRLACVERGTNVDDALAAAGTPFDVMPLAADLKAVTQWFRLEDQITLLCVAIGIPAPTAAEEDPEYLPDLDDNQRDAFERAYAKLIDAYQGTYPVVVEDVPFAVSKLAVRRKLRELGLESMLDTFLAANPARQKDWDDSQILLTTDPLLVSSIPAFAAATGTTDAQITDLLKSCRE